ncbi:MAG: hypothetical protein ABEK75_12415 [Salinibacter sp.]
MSRWKFLLLIPAAALLAVLGGSRSAAAQEAGYPAWFRAMPQSEQALWAVGYARGYRTLDAGMDSARADAYERLRRDRRVTIRGEKLYENAPGFRMSFEGARFARTGLPDTLRSVTYVDSLKAGGMTLVLAAWTPTDTSPSKPPPGGRAPFSETPPSWVRNGATSDGDRARAVGRASRYYYLEHSWRRAETKARRRLAFQAASKIERLEKSTEDWQHEVTSMQTKVRLRRVQTLARWGNEETCYVLVEGTVDEVLTDEK